MPMVRIGIRNRVCEWNLEAEMILRTFIHLTTEAIVLATVIALAVPFLLALSSPFIGR